MWTHHYTLRTFRFVFHFEYAAYGILQKRSCDTHWAAAGPWWADGHCHALWYRWSGSRRHCAGSPRCRCRLSSAGFLCYWPDTWSHNLARPGNLYRCQETPYSAPERRRGIVNLKAKYRLSCKSGVHRKHWYREWCLKQSQNTLKQAVLKLIWH